MSGVQGSNLIRRKKYRHYDESVCMWKKRKILTAVLIIHLQPILKEKREGAPVWNFYRLRKWIMGRVAWIKTDQFLRWRRVLCQFLGEKQKQRKGETGKKVEEERKEKHSEREREKESEEEKEESGGGTQRGKWCSKKPASTLDWNLKVPGSIPGSTLREIIHPKTTHRKQRILKGPEEKNRAKR